MLSRLVKVQAPSFRPLVDLHCLEITFKYIHLWRFTLSVGFEHPSRTPGPARNRAFVIFNPYIENSCSEVRKTTRRRQRPVPIRLQHFRRREEREDDAETPRRISPPISVSSLPAVIVGASRASITSQPTITSSLTRTSHKLVTPQSPTRSISIIALYQTTPVRSIQTAKATSGSSPTRTDFISVTSSATAAQRAIETPEPTQPLLITIMGDGLHTGPSLEKSGSSGVIGHSVVPPTAKNTLIAIGVLAVIAAVFTVAIIFLRRSKKMKR
ncbi:hypothetical protein BKA63DRAFT_491687 [Paraphoma chrysanthemicola]|nr:hypothetical protein BKA63DRAFT_491687 [Paraphoma chrysanthemicola]